MARKARKLTVNYSDLARHTLRAIWNWNAEHYDPADADAYVAFLRASADRLGTDYGKGRPVPTRPEYRYMTFRRSRRGHAHVAIYAVESDSVEVLAFFHTRQDWQGKAARGEV